MGRQANLLPPVNEQGRIKSGQNGRTLDKSALHCVISWHHHCTCTAPVGHCTYWIYNHLRARLPFNVSFIPSDASYGGATPLLREKAYTSDGVDDAKIGVSNCNNEGVGDISKDDKKWFKATHIKTQNRKCGGMLC